MPSRTAIPAVQGYMDIFGSPTPGSGQAVAQVVELPLNKLYEPEFHPFQVRDDVLMRETAASIKEYGVLVPGIARPRDGGGFELVAGNRRKFGCLLAELPTMPVIVRDMDDDEATIIMVDSNLQREQLLPSERAWAFRLKLEALNHRGRTHEDIPIGKLSVDVLVEEHKGERGFSKSNIYRFVRLTELVPALLDLVDENKMAVDTGAMLSYLSRVQQAQVLDLMSKYAALPSPSQAKRLKALEESGEWTEDSAEAIMAEEKKSEVKITLTAKKLVDYFPAGYTEQQMEAVILELLGGWKKSCEEIQIAERRNVA